MRACVYPAFCVGFLNFNRVLVGAVAGLDDAWMRRDEVGVGMEIELDVEI